MTSRLRLAAISSLILCLPVSGALAKDGPLMLAQAAPAAEPPAAAAPAPAPAPAPAAAPAPAPAAAAPAPAAAPTKMTGIAAWGKVVGNSVTGTEDGKVVVEFYAPDGTAKSMTGNEISSGKWALVGETVCFQYTDDPKMECYKLEVSGNTVTYTDEKGTGLRYEILAGNPKGL